MHVLRGKIVFNVIALGILIAFIVSSVSYAVAPSGGLSLTTSPVTLSLNVRPGATSSQTLSVKNNTSSALTINMEVKTFGAYGNSGQAAITDFPPGDPAASYIKLAPTTFVAQPGQWETVKATLSLPKVASLGFYYAIVFQPNLPTVNKPGTATIKGSNAILMLVNTGSANEEKQLKVTNFAVNKGLFEYLPASFTVTIHNPGNIYLAPVGDIYISRNSVGTNTIDTLPINAGAGNVLPDTNRIFTASWSDGFPVFQTVYKNGNPVFNKSGNPTQQLKWDFAKANKFRIGKYYAHLALAYNNGSREVLLNSAVSFWIVPWKLLIVLLFIVIIFGFGMFMLVRSIWRRIKRLRDKRQSKKTAV